MLHEKLQYLSGAVSTVVLAGSLPRKVPTDLYARMISDMTRRKVRTVIDCDGEPLRKALHAQPGLVSAEQREAEALVGHEFQTDEDFQDALDRDRRDGRRGRRDHAAHRLLRAPALGAGPRAHVPGVDPAGGVGVVGRLGGGAAGRVRGRTGGRAARPRSACGGRSDAVRPTRRRSAPACSTCATCPGSRAWSRCRRSCPPERGRRPDPLVDCVQL